MSADLVPLLGPYVTAAVGAYGTAVLARGQDAAADATVGLGRRILQRIFGIRAAEEAPEVLAELADDPYDEDLQAVLRVHIRKALAADEELSREIRAMLADAPAAETGVSVNAIGKRSIAAQTILGNAATGDDVDITHDPRP